MKIYFNAIGVIRYTDFTDEAIRQGNVGNTIKAYFTDKNNVNYTAKLNFTRPDGSKLTNLIMTPSPSESNLFTFVLNDEWYLALDGNATVTIFLYNDGGDIVANGQVTVAIESTDYDDDSDRPTTEQYNGLLALVAQKVNKMNTIIVVDAVSSINVNENDVGQLFYVKQNGTYYRIELDSNDLKQLVVAEKNGLLGGDHALLRFVIDDDTTLEELAGFGKMFVISYNLTPTATNEFLAYVNVVGSDILLYLLDIREMKLLSYSGAASDTFADFLDNAEETTYVERAHAANILHGTNNNGQESALPYSVTISADKIVQRDSNGHVKVPTLPTDGYDAINKAYSDITFGKKLEISIDENYVLTVKLLNSSNIVISQADIDLPLESIVVSARYYDSYTYEGTTYQNVIVITLATTSVPTIIPIGDLVSGLVSETTFNATVAQLQSNINGRVAKSITFGTFVYGHTNAKETEFAVTNNATSGTIPLRDTNGNIKVANTPSNGGDATSKTYVDTFGRSLEFTIDNSTYVMTLKLIDNNGNEISKKTVDLPLETMVVNGRYDDTNESLILELKNGQLITIPISDLISGLVTNTSLAIALANYYTQAQIDQMVSGFVFADVDDYLSATSENPVENKVVTEELNRKANKDGNYPTMTVGVADNLSPYDSESGDEQDEPFISQATGTGNGTQPDFSTGEYALLKEKQGNTVVVNQLAKEVNSTNLNCYSGTMSISNGEVTITGATGRDGVKYNDRYPLPKGHKMLFLFYSKGDGEHSLTASLSTYGQTIGKTLNYATTYALNQFIVEATVDNAYGVLDIFPTIVGAVSTFSFKQPIIADLTQWFNGDIPQDVLDNPSNFFRYYQGSLDYNQGELVNANGQYIKSIGMNQWDEETESGYIRSTNGVKINDSSKIRMKNPIRVIPNTTYYYKTPVAFYICCYDENMNFIKSVGGSMNTTFTTPSNCAFIQAGFESAYGTIYNNNISINLYYEDESRCLTYEPYRVLTNNDTGEEILRSVGNVKDTKDPDGTIHRLVGYNSNLTFERFEAGGDGVYRANISDRALTKNAVSDKYTNNKIVDVSNQLNNMEMFVSTGSTYIYVKNTSATSASDIVGTFYYELATPTTEQGTSYSENLVIDDFGSMDFGGDNGVPQGNLIFYPVDYKAFVDTMYNYTQGTPSNLATKSDITDGALNERGYYKQEDLSSNISNENANLTFVKKKLIKCGNAITLSLVASTTSSISSGSVLLTLPSGAFITEATNWLKVFVRDLSQGTNSQKDISISSSTGNITFEENVPNNTRIFLNISYVL